MRLFKACFLGVHGFSDGFRRFRCAYFLRLPQGFRKFPKAALGLPEVFLLHRKKEPSEASLGWASAAGVPELWFWCGATIAHL